MPTHDLGHGFTLEVDSSRYRLRRHGEPVDLPPDVLELLIEIPASRERSETAKGRAHAVVRRIGRLAIDLGKPEPKRKKPGRSAVLSKLNLTRVAVVGIVDEVRAMLEALHGPAPSPSPAADHTSLVGRLEALRGKARGVQRDELEKLIGSIRRHTIVN